MAKRKSNGYGKGTFIDTKMFLSEAFLSLGQPGTCQFVSGGSVQVLIMFLGKRQFGIAKDRKGQKTKQRIDDNRFTLTYVELLTYGARLDKSGRRVKGAMTNPKIGRAIDELLAKGFIEIVEHGGVYEKHKSIYALVDDWVNWKVGDPPIRLRQKDRRRGYQGKPLGAIENKNRSHERTHPHAHQRTHPPRGTRT